MRSLVDFRSHIYNLKFLEEDIIYNKKEKGIINTKLEFKIDDSEGSGIRISLIQILQMKMIINNFMECYEKYTTNPYISHINNFTTSFDQITYISSKAISFEDIDIILNDSQFNSKLFKCSLSKIKFFITNTPNEVDTQIVQDALKNYEHFYSRTNTKSDDKRRESDRNQYRIIKRRLTQVKTFDNENEVDKNSFIIVDDTKSMPKFNYFVMSKILVSIYFQNNNFSTWEPFIEPLPLIFHYFANKNHQFFNIALSYLEKLDLGIENISRQKNFHSLNINMSEFLIENIKAFKNDLDKSQLSNYYLRSSELEKRLVIINFTDCKYEIKNLNHFNEEYLLKSKHMKVLRYQIKKPIDYKEEVIDIEFLNNDKKKKKQRSINLINKDDEGNEDLNEPQLDKKIEGKGKFLLNIEKTSKFYFFIHVDNNNSLRHIDDNLFHDKSQSKSKLAEMLKNVQESILLDGEQFMISEVILNVDKNQKTVVFRSNYGIKNELDFKVKLKFIFKEDDYLYSNKISKERIVRFFIY